MKGLVGFYLPACMMGKNSVGDVLVLIMMNYVMFCLNCFVKTIGISCILMCIKTWTI